MTLTAAFGTTQVSFEKSMSEVERLLTGHGVRESRYTHVRPARLPARAGERGEETRGRVVFEFVWRRGEDARGVRITVPYQPEVGTRGGKAGTTPEMAARALYWLLKAKFDSIQYGIEEFEVAFMPHLVTSLGSTFAEEPHLITQAAQRPETIGQMLLPPPTGER